MIRLSQQGGGFTRQSHTQLPIQYIRVARHVPHYTTNNRLSDPIDNFYCDNISYEIAAEKVLKKLFVLKNVMEAHNLLRAYGAPSAKSAVSIAQWAEVWKHTWKHTNVQPNNILISCLTQ